MSRNDCRRLLTLASVIVVLTPLLPLGLGQAAIQPSTKKGEWPTYGADLANTRYSPLDQINATNFSKLQLAWSFKTDHLGPRPEFKLEGTPLMVGGALYTTAGTRRSVIALDAVTGELLWVHGEREGARAESAPRLLSGRGLAHWTDGRDERKHQHEQDEPSHGASLSGPPWLRPVADEFLPVPGGYERAGAATPRLHASSLVEHRHDLVEDRLEEVRDRAALRPIQEQQRDRRRNQDHERVFSGRLSTFTRT